MVQFSCKLSCTPSLWNPRESRLNGKSREAVVINGRLDKLLLAVTGAYDSLIERKQPFTAEDVKNRFQGSVDTQMTLLKLFDRITDELKMRIGIDRAAGTLPTYTYTRRALAEFIRKKFNASNLAFGQLNEQFIREFQDFVLTDKGLAMDTLRHYLALLKNVCKVAYKEGHSEKHHFAHYKLPKQKETTPKALSREDFEKIRDLEIAENRTSHIITRDLFLFACYTGLSYVDVRNLQESNIREMEDGSKWIIINRQKTGTPSYIPLLDISIRIIEKYRGTGKDGKLFNLMNSSEVNLYLKDIAKAAGIDKRLSYHVARHSFSTSVCLSQGVPIETLSQMLGHTNIKTTQIYAEVTKTKINEDMTNLAERIQGKYKFTKE